MKKLIVIILAAVNTICNAQIKIITGGENQNIGNYQYNRKTNTLIFEPGKDSCNTTGVWFNFGITGYRKDTVLTLIERAEKFVHLSNFPAISDDNVTFERIRAMHTGDGAKVTLGIGKDTLYMATGYPYTYTRLKNYLENHKNNKNLEIRKIRTTDNALDVNLLTINYKKYNRHPKKLVWIICRQHAFETTSSFVMEGMMDYLLSGQCDKNVQKKFIFKIVPMVDVESVYSGQTGRMQKPRDYNRDWNNPIHETIRLIENEIEQSSRQYDYHTFWDIHGTYPGGIVGYSFSYFDIWGEGPKSQYIRDYWNQFYKICGFRPRHLNDDSFAYEGTPADMWNMRTFENIKVSATLEMDWNLDNRGKPWTMDQYKQIGADMIKAMGKKM